MTKLQRPINEDNEYGIQYIAVTSGHVAGCGSGHGIGDGSGCPDGEGYGAGLGCDDGYGDGNSNLPPPASGEGVI